MMAKYKDPFKTKCKILYDLGLTNTQAVAEHLSNAKDIDEAARKMLDNFYEGDNTFVEYDASPEFYMRFIKAKYPRAETLYEDVLISLIGQKGFIILRQNHCIEPCAMLNGRKLYAL